MKGVRVILSLGLLFLVGCQTSIVQGLRIDLQMEDLAKKLQDKDDFAIVFTQSGCGGCESFVEMMNTYASEKETVIYDVNIATQSMSKEDVVSFVKPIFPNFSKTPSLYYVEDGVVVSDFWDEYDSLEEDSFTAWYEEHRVE